MAFRADLFAFLQADASLTALIDDRIYPGFAPTDKPSPYITYERSSQITTHHQAIGNSTSIIERQRFQFDCWAKTEIEADAIKDALVLLLDGFTGIMNSASDVRRVFLQNVIDNHEDPIDGSQIADHRTTADFEFWYFKLTP